ncbi:selenocysteine-specific translation elongation factor [Spiroplasma alleghenense]|uniref:Selenocysteine-specific elongation factor n=1 Tax=Spiroplasma alleghenense TaxID=216931 RepID=A0A345Z2Q2_9MOLU|nr:selenocysteine-specific translation elongation factor [Spiroplasma alleghenense]AXK50881.1 Selenocysteine-specific elongation factor [Spiroplasma alleghenense]
MKEICLGVLGHVDHGKTTVVQHITNKDTDHLKEEKKRGMSINIAFSFYQAPKKLIGFIDLPGHEKFIKNMIAGASSVNAGLLVVACDDGMMPQTFEHLLIFKIFKITNLIVVFTKTDLVGLEQITKIKKDVQDYLKENSFKIFDSVEVSNKNPDSYEKLKIVLDNFSNWFSENIPDKINYSNNYRLDIDRSFTIQGKGTIITGTTKTGTVCENDELEILPKKIIVKVKEIQVNDQRVANAKTGQRTALRIGNINFNEISRGDIIATPGTLLKSKLIDVYLNYDKTNISELKNKSKVKVFIGTKNYLAKVKILVNKKAMPGEMVFAQLEFSEPIYFQLEDIGLIKLISEENISGGFEILRVSSKSVKSKNQDYLTELEKIKFGDFIEKTIIEIKNNPDKVVDLFQFGLRETNISHEELIIYQNKVIHISNYFDLRDKILFQIKKYHANNPLKKGINFLEINSTLKEEVNSKHLNFILYLMIQDGLIKVENQMYSLKNFELKLTKEQHAIKNLILRRIKDWDLKPKEISVIKEKVVDTKTFKEMLKYLISNKSIVQLDENNFITATNYQKVIDKVDLFFSKNKSLNIDEAKTLLDLNHKYVVLILEKMDYDKITLIKNEVRVRNLIL